MHFRCHCKAGIMADLDDTDALSPLKNCGHSNVRSPISTASDVDSGPASWPWVLEEGGGFHVLLVHPVGHGAKEVELVKELHA